MRAEMDSDFEKNCTVGLSPNTVLPSQQNFLYTKKRSTKPRSSRKDELLTLKGDFREISFSRYRSVSCKNVPRRISQECNTELRRGSVYQSSKEFRRMKEMGTTEERQKIEISRSSETSLSIMDSLCGSDEEILKRRSQKVSLSSTSDGFFEICLDPCRRGKNSAEHIGDKSTNLSLKSDSVTSPQCNGNELLERDAAKVLPKSVSAKVEMPSSPSVSESDCSSKASSKTRFSPIKKMFENPFVKSKSLRSPLSYVLEPGEKQFNKTCLKSEDPGCESKPVRSKNQAFVSSSPVHLHGYLKLENKHGLPFFEFSLQRPGEVFVAKTWKAKDTFNWAYTFHSIDGGKKSNASRLGSHENDRDSSMVGQMQVSCYLCSELKDGVFDNSMVTEFVLYDIAHARLSISSEENSKPSKASDPKLVKETLDLHGTNQMSELDSSNSYPWASVNLNPSLEIAAIVLQTPFEKRESLKHKQGEKCSNKAHKNLLNLPLVEPRKHDVTNDTTRDKVKVVLPAGNHGLPSSEGKSPSALLDRWRFGGGCDCGGWDMGCPLTVLGNPHFHCTNSQSLVENQMPMELFVQGAKEIAPALTMTVIEEGLYAVDFHAQLSTLQAFSICVAILHGTESPTDSGEDQKVEISQGDSLKVLIEEEVKFLIEAVTSEKKSVTKRVKEIPPSYVLNPPFSPIARV